MADLGSPLYWYIVRHRLLNVGARLLNVGARLLNVERPSLLHVDGRSRLAPLLVLYLIVV